eukprot:m.1395827 g.1395827  ORF g.1395827 m.1395827 type:complete len:212 (+) comp24994_c1_seq37:1393-2028(+)
MMHWIFLTGCKHWVMTVYEMIVQYLGHFHAFWLLIFSKTHCIFVDDVKPTIITYSTLINACANAKPASRFQDALRLWTQMQSSGLTPNVVTFNNMILACANAKDKEQTSYAAELFDQMINAELQPNEYTLPALLKCATHGPAEVRSKNARRWFEALIGPVRLNSYTREALRWAVGKPKSAELIEWAIRERPDCMLQTQSRPNLTARIGPKT